MKVSTMSLDESTSTNEPKDFFGELYSDSSLKQMAIVIYFFGFFLGIILPIGIIWYERNGHHNYRTVLNQLFSSIAWIIICYHVLVYIPEGIRYLNGPLPTTFCDIHHFLKNFLACCFILLFDGIICLRYIFIFKWGKVSVFDDNLVASFIQMSVLTLSFWMSLVKRMSVGRMPLNYFMCAGKNPNGNNDPEPTDSTPRQYDTTVILVFLSFGLHLFASTKIFLYQRQMEKRTNDIELGRMNDAPSSQNDQRRKVAWEDCEASSVRRTSRLPKSMADLTTQMLCLIFLVGVAVLNMAINDKKPVELNQYENRWLVYFNQIIAISVALSGICFQYYAKNDGLRNAIWRNMAASIQRTSRVHQIQI